MMPDTDMPIRIPRSIRKILDVELYTYIKGERVVGRGHKFVVAHQGRPIFFADLNKLRETGKLFAASGGRRLLNERFGDLIDHCVCVGSNWDGIKGFYK